MLDTVIQRLFALGLTVQSVAMSLEEDERTAELIEVVAGIDATIGVVRGHMTELLAGAPRAGGAAAEASA